MVLRAACIQTRNAPALAAFYTRVFGCEPFVDGGVDYQFRAQQLTVFQLDEDDGPPTENVALVYTVEDVDAVCARLEGLGLANGARPTDKPWGVRSFFVRDPDGNMVSFVKDL